MVSSGTGSPALPRTTTTKIAGYPQWPMSCGTLVTRPPARGSGARSRAGRPAGDHAQVTVFLENDVADGAQRHPALLAQGGPQLGQAEALMTQAVFIECARALPRRS